MPVMKRHKSIPKPLVWHASTSVLSEYQISDPVNTARRP